MDPLKQLFFEKSSQLRTEMRQIAKTHGSLEVEHVRVGQILGGMRGLKSMTWETSDLDANKGIKFRGYSIPELQEMLPKLNGTEPLPEGLFWLMLVDEIPSAEQVKWLADEWEKRSKIPQGTKDVLDALPKSTHPMIQFTIGIASLSSESVFAKRYSEGMSKSDYWDASYEDAMNLVAKIPLLAAYIYRNKYHDGQHIEQDLNLDWAANFAHMLGNDSPDFYDLMRLYLLIHADHEGGNASAHTSHLVNSTLSDMYLSFSAGMDALAGPLHGLANQEVIKWVLEMLEFLGTEEPTNEQIKSYVEKTLSEGKVIPGYGHAVLRQPDPRFMAQKGFAEKHLADDKLVNVIWQVFEVVPPVLQGLGKVKNPWPNVDAHSGAILVHYGIKEFEYYTVLFGVSRALGICAAMCWSRAMGLPLERPKSVSSDWVKNFVTENT